MPLQLQAEILICLIKYVRKLEVVFDYRFCSSQLVHVWNCFWINCVEAGCGRRSLRNLRGCSNIFCGLMQHLPCHGHEFFRASTMTGCTRVVPKWPLWEAIWISLVIRVDLSWDLRKRTDSICFGIFKVGCHICCICRQEVLQKPLQLAMIAGGSQGFYLYGRLVRLSNCTMTQANNFITHSSSWFKFMIHRIISNQTYEQSWRQEEQTH